jgi:hypothetical protein
MALKGAVVYEYDLEKGLCFIAERDGGKGDVPLFDTRQEAEDWVASGGDIDADLWDISSVRVRGD